MERLFSVYPVLLFTGHVVNKLTKHEDEEVRIIGKGPFARKHWEGHFVGQRKQDPRLIGRLGAANGSLRVATKEHADLSLYDQHDVRDLIDVLVERGGVEGVKGKDEECF